MKAFDEGLIVVDELAFLIFPKTDDEYLEVAVYCVDYSVFWLSKEFCFASGHMVRGAYPGGHALGAGVLEHVFPFIRLHDRVDISKSVHNVSVRDLELARNIHIADECVNCA